jgi:hypothetical protein
MRYLWPLFIGLAGAASWVFGPSIYHQWMHGYGTACDVTVLGEASSPSGKWLAVTRWVDCSSIMAGSSVQVVLKPVRPLLPFLAPEEVAFERALQSRAGDNPLQIYVRARWDSDQVLELETVPSDDRCSGAKTVGEVRIVRRVSTLN